MQPEDAAIAIDQQEDIANQNNVIVEEKPADEKPVVTNPVEANVAQAEEQKK